MHSFSRLVIVLLLSVALPAVAAESLDGGGPLAAKADKPRKGKGKGEATPEATPPPPPPDADGDGIPDGSDRCPQEAEDRDGNADEDGCLDADDDGDGVPDVSDACPKQAENVDGWDDADGCPESAPKIKPFLIEAELMDGTKLKGRVIRILAVDEDKPDAAPGEPADFDVIVDETAEFKTGWENLKAMKSEKVVFTDAVDCYSEGVEELGDSTTWECTLKHPVVVTLKSSEKKGVHRVLDREMRRLDWKIELADCAGPSCAPVQESRTLPLYLYKLVASEKNDDESKAVAALQGRLRELQKRQIKTAMLSPVD